MNNTQELLDIAFIDKTVLGCNQVIKCPYQERTISYAIGVEIPVPAELPEKVFKECCYQHLTLADANSADDFKNDYSSFYHQRQLSNETVNFFLYDFSDQSETALVDGTFGQFFGFGFFDSNVNLKGYLVEWKKVLAGKGEGTYKIIKRIIIAGVSVEFSSIVFTLKQFSTVIANTTTRMDVVMNGLLEKSKVDFTGTGWKHSLRLPGFFGRRDPSFEEDNIVNRSFEKRQVSMAQTNEYKFQTNNIPYCLTDEVFDFMLFANDIYFNDYNLNNHSYNFVKFGVKLSANDGTEYGVKTRKARLNITFNDKFENNLKRNYK